MTKTRTASSDYSSGVLADMTRPELVAERRGLLEILDGARPMPAWMTRLYATEALAILDATIKGL